MKTIERVVHGVVVVLVALGLHLLLMFVLLFRLIFRSNSYVTEIPDIWDSLLAWSFQLVLALFLGLAALAIIKRLSWKIILPLILVEAGAFTYLLWDDPAKPGPPDLGPRLSSSDESYHVVMWMSRDSPYSRLKEPGVLHGEAIDLRLPADRSAWPEHVRKHRQEIMAAWDQDALGREWVDAINAHPPKGIWPQSLSDPLIAFQPIWASTSVRTARAYVLALDGQRDEAIQSLIPFLSCWQHLERSGECLVNEGIARVVLKQSYGVIGETLKLGPISNETRAALRRTLDQAPPMRQILRNAILGEQDVSREAFDNIQRTGGQPDRDDAYPLVLRTDAFPKAGGRLMAHICLKLNLNRNRTEREYVGYLQHAYELAAAKKVDLLIQIEAPSRSWTAKNLIGSTLIDMAKPALGYAVKSSWQAEDQRLALLAQLAKP